MNDYFAYCMAWSFIGLIIGLILGYAGGYAHVCHLRRKMTSTPISPRRKIRRMFRIEGVTLLVVGVLFTGYSYIDSQRQAASDDCLTDQVTKLTAAIESRGTIAGETIRINEEVILRQAQAAGKPNRDELVDKALDDYVIATNKLEKSRVKAVIPPFPNGKCDV